MYFFLCARRLWTGIFSKFSIVFPAAFGKTTEKYILKTSLKPEFHEIDFSHNSKSNSDRARNTIEIVLIQMAHKITDTIFKTILEIYIPNN